MSDQPAVPVSSSQPVSPSDTQPAPAPAATGSPATDGARPDHGGRGTGRRVEWSVATLVGALAVAAIVGGAVGALTMARLAPGDDRACRSVDLAQRTLPSVVTVLTAGESGAGNGTGQLIRPGGYVLTNYHVIAPVASGGTLTVEYSDGERSQATVVGSDPATDLAVIKAADGAADRPLITIGTSESLQAGQPVVALGAPLGLQSTVTAGIVSALGRLITVPLGSGTAHLVDAIQTDASINPGNSGGPLVDCAGRLIGINTAISTVPNAQGVGGGGSVGVGFAIPIDLANPIADQLISTGRALHPDLGLAAQALVGDSGGAPVGLFVTTVDPGGPADRAGVKTGDIIIGIEGQPARSLEQLVLQTLKRNVGDTVTVALSRQGQDVEAKIVLGEPR